MSDKGEKTCPLCAEEMDLTDQQLKPCKCGYDICVWCWNHIMEMAEKDSTEGRCPACRSCYDKEKIVGMAANCERLVAEMNSERKLKSQTQKVRPKTPEGRMHLTNVRVIQRNLVYIIGLPLNLADEALLQRREYFGQYGKVLKVSISRTATGAIQHSSNNSCCVYITYGKEEEAIRCIQTVHSFVLEGKPLRACFGTTKYCHAWLKNMPCSIPDCLYLHDFGSQEDSFTKDDLVSAFTRSRVEQIVGASNNLHRRSGNVLPPPVDDYTNRDISSTAKVDSKISSNNIGNWDNVSGVDCSTGRSNALSGPASWVMRASTSLPPVTSLSQADAAPNHKGEMSDGPLSLASEVLSTKSSSNLKSTTTPDGNGHAPEVRLSRDQLLCLPASQDIDRHSVPPPSGISSLKPPSGISSLKPNKLSSVISPDEVENFHAGEAFQGVCYELSSISIGSYLKDKHSDPFCPERSSSKHNLSGSLGFQQEASNFVEASIPEALSKSNIVEDFLHFDDRELEDLRVAHHRSSMSWLPYSEQHKEQSSYHIREQSRFNHHTITDAHPSSVPVKCDEVAYPSTSTNQILSNGFSDNHANGFTEWDRSSKNYSVSSIVRLDKVFEEHDNNWANVNHGVAPDTGESSIISNILSLDSDAWEDSLTSPESLVKLLAKTDQRCSSLKMPCFRKIHDSTQSKFSFAWHDDSLDQMDNSSENKTNRLSVSQTFVENKDTHMDKYHAISSNRSSELDGFLGWHPLNSSSFPVSKYSTSPPPGFSAPNGPVPPGFLMHATQDFHPSGNLEQKSVPPSRNASFSENVDFIDPAIMEVGKGFLSTRPNNPGFDARPALSPQFSPFDHDIEYQMLMHQPISLQQNSRFSDHFGNKFSPQNDAYSVSPMHLGQSPPNKPSVLAAQQLRNLHMSNGRWSSWNEVRSVGDLGMPELLTNGGLRFNKFIPSYEELKCQIPSSSTLYNRGFAI